MPAIAVAGSTPPDLLRAAGWRVAGRLPAMPYDDPGDAPSYLDLEDLLADDRLDAVALDGHDAGLARHLPALRQAGLLVLLPTPAPLDLGLLRVARAVPDAPDVAVGLLARWQSWACTVAAALPLAGGPPLQVTVRGWPRGEQAAAELADLVAGWCGEIAAAVAAPAALPARALPGGEGVAWALLTASGASVLVSHEGPAPLVRLSFAHARLEAGPGGARWQGGAPLPLLPVADRRPVPLHVPAGTDPGLLACAHALLAGVGGGDLSAATWPWPADLGDLVVVSRVLQALRESALAGRPVLAG